MTHTTKHTPGPWVAEESDGNLAKVSYTGTGLRSVIARLHENSLCNEHTGSVNANAHLIAAAPAMYAALKLVMEMDRTNICDEAIVCIAGALAQAEGSKP